MTFPILFSMLISYLGFVWGNIRWCMKSIPTVACMFQSPLCHSCLTNCMGTHKEWVSRCISVLLKTKILNLKLVARNFIKWSPNYGVIYLWIKFPNTLWFSLIFWQHSFWHTLRRYIITIHHHLSDAAIPVHKLKGVSGLNQETSGNPNSKHGHLKGA